MARGYRRSWRAGAIVGDERIGVSNQILRHINAIFYARQPKIQPLINKAGYIRPTIITVKKGNPKQVRNFDDLLTDGMWVVPEPSMQPPK